MPTAVMSGTRLAYVVMKIPGTVTRIKTHLAAREIGGRNKDGTKRKMFERKDVKAEVPGGYMVFFPRGHVLRMNIDQLRHHKLHMKPKLINLQGLEDPNSPLGQLLSQQDEAARRGAYQNLESQVVALATRKTGIKLLTLVQEPDVTRTADIDLSDLSTLDVGKMSDSNTRATVHADANVEAA